MSPAEEFALGLLFSVMFLLVVVLGAGATTAELVPQCTRDAITQELHCPEITP